MANLTILSQDVRVQDGLYSLNDLHKAAGMIKRNQPANFMRLDTTKELVVEIEHSSDLRSGIEESKCTSSQYAVRSINGGFNRGTWVCKELVYAYAMWVSPSFHLKVIRAFDQAHTSNKSNYHFLPRRPQTNPKNSNC